MRFRAPLKRKWFYPFVLCGLILVGAVLVDIAFVHPSTLFGGPESLPEVLGWLLMFTLAFIGTVLLSWNVWTSCVDIGDAGVRWKEGADERFMPWETISSLTLEGKTLGLVDRASGKSHRLPFASRKIYTALTKQLKPLTPAEEEILFPRG